MAKYKIPNLLGVSVGGEQYKAGKDGLFEMPHTHAMHLSNIYQVVKVDGKSEEILGPGTGNLPQAKAAAVGITKESLLAQERGDLVKKCESLGIRVLEDWSKGDMADAVLDFLRRLESKFPAKR